VSKNIKLNQPTIPTNEVLEGTEKYLTYCLLGSYVLIFIMLIIGIFKDEYEWLFRFVFISSGVVVAGNIYSFNVIDRKLKKAAANCEISQLTNIIDSDSQNADAYFLRGQAKKEINEYLSALRDFNKAHSLKDNLSDYLKQSLDENMRYCKAKIK